MQALKRVLDLTCRVKRGQKGLGNLVLQIPNLSYLGLLNGSKNVQNVIRIVLKWLFFSEKWQKSPSGWGLRSKTPITPVGDVKLTIGDLLR